METVVPINFGTPNASLPLVIKAVIKDEMRRFSLEQGSYSSLVHNIGTTFNIPDASSMLVIKYIDDEGDEITISSEQEFSEAARIARNHNAVLKVFITEKKPLYPSNSVDVSSIVPTPVPVKADVKGEGSYNPPKQCAGGQAYHWKKWKMEKKLRKQEKKAEKQMMQAQVRRAKDAGDKATAEKLQSDLKEWKKNWKREKMSLRHEVQAQMHAHRAGIYGHPHAHYAHPHPNHHQFQPHHGAPQFANSHYGHHGHHGHHDHPRGCEGKFAKLAGGRFVKHVTCEDGSEMSPGQQFIKTWRFRNESNTAWPANTKMQWVGGDKLSATDFVVVPQQVNSGTEVDISIPMIAPNKAGRYTSYFRLVGNETKFGQRVWAQVWVTDSSGSDKDDSSVNVKDEDCVKYQQQLKVLAEMNFNQVKLNVKLLKKHDGNLQLVVQRLLKRNQKLGGKANNHVAF